MYLGIDIGGTKTLIALFSKHGHILKKVKFRTAKGQKTFLDNLLENLVAFKKYRVKSIVVAIPGLVQKNYSVQFGNRNWSNIDIFTPIKGLFDVPIYFENDANLAALYEAKKLAGRTVFLTFSTGIGGGIVENGKISPESSAFEPGHKIYSYNGQDKEWEDIAAASAIGAYYHIDRATDLRKKEAMQDIAKRIYLGLPDIIKEYHPKTIILGGPLGRIFRLYSKHLPKIPEVKLIRPKRPNESPIYGCYIFAKQKSKQ